MKLSDLRRDVIYTISNSLNNKSLLNFSLLTNEFYNEQLLKQRKRRYINLKKMYKKSVISHIPIQFIENGEINNKIPNLEVINYFYNKHYYYDIYESLSFLDFTKQELEAIYNTVNQGGILITPNSYKDRLKVLELIKLKLKNREFKSSGTWINWNKAKYNFMNTGLPMLNGIMIAFIVFKTYSLFSSKST